MFQNDIISRAITSNGLEELREYSDGQFAASVNNVEPIDGNISLTTDEVPDTTTRQYVPQSPATCKELCFLNGNNEFSMVTVGNSGAPTNLYLSSISNTFNNNYKALSYINENSTTEISASVTNNEVLLQKYLYNEEIGITNIDAGNWLITATARVDKVNGITRLKAEVFKLSNTNVETLLFSSYTCEINSLTNEKYKFEIYQNNITVLATDRLGVKLYAYTDSNTAINVTLAIGDGTASYVNTPLMMRHDQLRGKNDNIEFQHITSADRTALNNLQAETKTFDIIEITNRLRLINDGTTFEDYRTPLTQGKLTSGGKPDFDSINCGYLFPQNDTSEYMVLRCQLPHEWKQGSDIYPHVHWRQKANQAVTFKIDYKWYNDGDLEPVSWTTLTMNTNYHTYTSGTLAQRTYGSSISGTGKTISSLLLIKLYRDDNTYTGDALVDDFDFHYEKDSLGSEAQLTKL